MSVGPQDETIVFLSNAASFGLPGALVERIETHCSIVFLVDDRAYKLKRAVAFSALDYSTVEKREAACRAELALNQRTAPELYLAIRAIRRTLRGALAFADEGPVVDWVVIMRRFDQADLFDRLADAHRLTPALVCALADEIAAFHAGAERTPSFGGAAGLRDAVERNRCDHASVEVALGRDAIEALHAHSLDTLAHLAEGLDRRRAAGKVRRCHGDLRLANICLFDGRPTLFDAIEFADAISCSDVQFDLAFVLMDLYQRGFSLLANILCNRYLDVTADHDGLAALPLMLSIRAATRAYSLAGAAQRRTGGNADSSSAAARSHLVLASSLLEPVPPRLIALGGVQGSAKTALAHGLAATFRPVPGARVLLANVALRAVRGLPLSAQLKATDDDATADAMYERLERDAAQVLRAGFTAVVDASFVHATHRHAMAAAASAAGVPFVGLWRGPLRDLQAGDAGGWYELESAPASPSVLAAAQSLVAAAAS